MRQISLMKARPVRDARPRARRRAALPGLNAVRALNGPAIQRWPTPDCFATGSLKNGRRDGRWTVFGPTGQVIAITLWKNGELVHSDEDFGRSKLRAA
jgi:hypothetical protein